MLLNVLLISGGVHIAALLVLGGITVVKFIIPDEAAFEEPPAIEETEPPKEVKVEIKPQAAPQQQAMQNLKMRQVGNIAVDNVDVDLPTMEQSFTVSSGLGGFGGGALLGGTRGSIGIGMSDISVFGLKSRAERVLFAIDASRTMLTDQKGGLNSYNVIKDEITDMVANLSAGTLFNVVFYEDGRFHFFKPRPVPAGSEVTAELAKWVAPINSNINQLGLRSAKPVKLTAMPNDNAIKQNLPRHQWHSGNENAYLSQVFLEQSIDAIFVITGRHGGFQNIIRSLSKEEDERLNKKFRDVVATEAYKEYDKRYHAERAEAHKLAVAEKKKRDAERQARGLPPQVFDGGDLIDHMGIKTELKHPHEEFGIRHTGALTVEQRDVERYFKDLLDVLYEDQGQTPPSINVVLFLAGDEAFSKEQEDRLKDYTRFFRGRHRIIRGLDEIKRAQSAGETTN